MWLIVPHLIHAHIDTLGQVPLNVLQEYIGRGASDPLDLHESSVCADLVLNTVLLIDVWWLENSELLYTSGQGNSARRDSYVIIIAEINKIYYALWSSKSYLYISISIQLLLGFVF